jgi:hypothetical protein
MIAIAHLRRLGIHRRPSLALLLCAAIAAMPGCAYQLQTGHRDVDRSARWFENWTRPFCKTCAEVTGGALALVGLGAAEVAEDECENYDSDHPHATSDQGSQSSGDNSNPGPVGKPLR